MTEAAFTELHAGPLSSAEYGQKAALLAAAVAQGERVPQGFVVSAREAVLLAAGDVTLVQRFARSLERLSASGPVAVRSSPTLSLPGALLTRLSIAPQLEPALLAVREVLASVSAKAALDQLRARGLNAPAEPWCGVLVQSFVQVSDDDALGMVVCTRNPNTGELGPFGEHVPHEGVDAVVSGRKNPRPVALAQVRRGQETQALEHARPALFSELRALCERLEQAFLEPLELELMHAGGVTWLLQARPLALTPRAIARLTLEAIEHDSPRYMHWLRRLVDEGVSRLVEARLPPPERIPASRHIGRGLAASPGVGRGVLVIDLESALSRAESEPVVLARRDAVPEDVAAFRASQAVITTSGGLTSHAAVIARGLRVPAVVGASQIQVDTKRRCLLDPLDTKRVLASEGDVLTVDGHRGMVYAGDVAAEPAVNAPELEQLLGEARKLRRMPLWVRGPAAQVLQMRQVFQLDGALCLHGDEPLPELSGRDHWLEVAAEHALALLPQLPACYGVVLCGAVNDALIAEVRKASRLRAVGVRATPGAAPLASALDILVIDAGTHVSELPVRASKIVRLLDSDADFSLLGHESSGAVACDPTKALRFALGLASLSRPPS